MDGVAKRELTEVEMILGKGMLYDSSELTELVNMYYLRYGIIIEVVWYPNLKKWLPNVRTIAYTPKEVGNKKLVKNIRAIGVLYKSYFTEYFSDALQVALNIAELYVVKRFIYWNDSYILSFIKSNSVYEDIIGLLDKVDNYDIYKGLYDRVFDEINKDYITGSILYCLTNHIKEHGWEKTYNEIF